MKLLEIFTRGYVSAILANGDKLYPGSFAALDAFTSVQQANSYEFKLRMADGLNGQDSKVYDQRDTKNDYSIVATLATADEMMLFKDTSFLIFAPTQRSCVALTARYLERNEELTDLIMHRGATISYLETEYHAPD